MPERFLNLATKEPRDILAVAQTRTGKNAVVLEKDVWLCWTLAELFSMPNGPRMVFKGGTSLSKVFDLIGRFSASHSPPNTVFRFACRFMITTIFPRVRCQ